MDVYVDEEDLLGFHVFVAELELLWGTCRGDAAVDKHVLMELLQKLLVSIDHTKSETLRQFQRRCEKVLSGLLLKGISFEVRHLICKCLSKLYTEGDSLPIYSYVNLLQGFLASKEALSKRVSENVRLGALECLAHLCIEHGSCLLSAVPGLVAVAVKHASKGGNQTGVRAMALLLAAVAVKALGPDKRSAPAVQAEALKLAEKCWKASNPEELRVGSILIIQSLAHAGGCVLWAQGASQFEQVVQMCVSGLEDASHVIRTTSGEALGELAASVKSTTAEDSVHLETRQNRKLALEQTLKQGLQRCIIRPFVEAAVFNKKDVCTAIAKAWVSYIAALYHHTTVEEHELVEVALQLVNTLAAASGAYNEAKSKGLLEHRVGLGFGMSSGELPVAQSCVLYVLRVGILRRLSETGQRQLLDRLATLVASVVGEATPVAVVAMGGIQVLLEVLGEVHSDAARSIEAAVMEKVVASSSAVRSQAAAALGSIARADPSCAAPLSQSVMDCLKVAADQLASLSAPYGASHPLPWSLIPGSPGSPGAGNRPTDATNSMKMTMYAVYGHSLCLAGLLVASRCTPLGAPSKLYADALQLTEELVLNPKTPVTNAQAVEKKAGYCVLGALCVAVPKEALAGRRDLLTLFAPALGREAKRALTEKRMLAPGQEVDLAMQLWWRAAALEALQAYITSILLKGLVPRPRQQMTEIIELLSPLVEVLTSTPGFQDPVRAPGGPGGWVAGCVATLQLRMLQVYNLLPSCSAFSQDHEGLVKLCSKSIRGATAVLSSPGVASYLSRTSLHSFLEIQDGCLGPWHLDGEPLEEQLEIMAGEKGAPQMHPWEAGMGVWGVEMAVGKGGESVRANLSASPFPQDKSLGLALLEAQMKVLGRLLGRIAPKNKMQILEILIGTLRKAQTVKDAGRQNALVTCACCTALSGLQLRAALQKANAVPSDEVAEKVLGLASAILDVCGSNQAFKRAAGELIGCASALGTDSFAARCVQQICQEVQTTGSPDKRAALAFALGCIFRLKGGMPLQSVLPKAVETLFSLVRRPVGEVYFWVLHGLWLTANAAGLAYMPYVRNSLLLGRELMTSNLDVAQLRPYIGRITNAMVAVLGPELAPGGKHYMSCKMLMRQMEATTVQAGTLIGKFQTSSAELELVLYAQQLILFAPQAVPAKKHVPMLLTVLSSPHPSVRHASVMTLRQLVERDPDALAQHSIERHLFAALDRENEAHITSAIQSTLTAMELVQCPSKPSKWLQVCSQVVLAAPKESSGRGKLDRVDDRDLGDDRLMAEDDEGDEVDARMDSMKSQTAQSKQKDELWTSSTPRLKTRLFACQCLLSIFEAVGSDERHFNLLKALASKNGKDWLITKAQDLVKLGFSLATGQVEALRPQGVRLLDAVIRSFSAAEDPMVEDTKLLFQFQAQFVSPLRLALAPEAPPLLFMPGATLAVSFLKSGLAGGDVAVLKQLMALLVSPMQEWQRLQYINFSEWVGARARVALLEAHAHCAFLAIDSGDSVCCEIVTSVQERVLDDLKRFWLGFLMDYIVVSRWQSTVWAEYKPVVITVGNQSGSALDKQTLDEAWPVVMQALSRNLPAAQEIQSLGASKTDQSDQGDLCDPDDASVNVLEEEMGHGDRCRSSEGASTSGSNADGSEHSVDLQTQLKISVGGVKYTGVLTAGDVYWRFLNIATSMLGTSAVQVIERARMEEGPNRFGEMALPVLVCVRSLEKLLSGEYLGMQGQLVNVCTEVLEMVMAVLQQVVHPLLCSVASMDASSLIEIVSAVSKLTKSIAEGVPPSVFGLPDFSQALLESSLGCLSILSPKHSSVKVSETCQETVEGVVCGLEASCVWVTSCPWEMTCKWIGTLMQQAMQTAGSFDDRKVFQSVKEFLVTAAKVAVKNTGFDSENMDMSPIEFVVWCGLGLMDIAEGEIANLQSSNRLQCMLCTLLELAAVTLHQPDDNGTVSQFHEKVLEWFNLCLSPEQSPKVQSVAIETLRAFAQASSTASNDSNRQWAVLCVARIGPHVARLIKDVLDMDKSPIAGVFLQVVAECLKFFFVSTSLVEHQGVEAQTAILNVFVPLLIEASDPPTTPTPALIDMVIKLINHLSAGPVAPAFKLAVTALSVPSKQRLQKVLKMSMTKGGSIEKPVAFQSGQSNNSGTPQKPSIVLKNFAVS